MRSVVKVLPLALLLLAAPSLMAMPAPARANQFVLFDVTFTFTKEDAENSKPSKSHYYVKGDLINPDRPKDWTAPVDYRNGTVHVRTEVLEKPAGSEPTTWSLVRFRLWPETRPDLARDGAQIYAVGHVSTGPSPTTD